MMQGNGLICLKINQHSFHEHASLTAARAEAHRLADTLQAEIVVYVPVLLVAPPKRTNESPILPDADTLDLLRGETLPF